ncbi:hypothetical protein FRB97_004797 [Tulasnella sp. 331]|nr:hypothetical protein FRB97_004797 [Tulasnella sp. 331]
MSADMLKRIDGFYQELKAILMSIQPYTEYKWFHHYWRKTTISDVVSAGTARLDECARNFQIVGVIELNRMLESAASTLQEQKHFQDALLGRLEEHHETARAALDEVRKISDRIQPTTGGLVDLGQIDIEWEACLDRTNDHPATQLCSAVLVTQVGEPRVIVKAYPPAFDEQLFLQDLKRLSNLRHPNVPHLIGRSARNAEAPFAVFKEVNAVSLHDRFLRSMKCSAVDGFMFALSVLQGTASALQYMTGHLKLGTKDLKACMEIGNLGLSRTGKVVVGHGLILSGPTTSYDGDLSKWLMRHFWCLTNEVLYGEEEPIDDCDWIAMRNRLNTHVHALSTLVAYDCPDFNYMTSRLTSILQSLEDLRRSSDQQMIYSDIRQQLLRAPRAHLCFVYRPFEAIDVSLGDIGYMDGNSFVRLANIKDDVAFHTVLNGNVEYVHSAPPDIRMEKLGDGIVNNVVRQGNAEHIDGIPSLWPHFIRRAPAIALGAKGLRPEDLILIASIQKGWRGTRLECKPDGHLNPDASFLADFIEPCELPAGREWGTWVVDGFEIRDPMRKMETEWTMTPNGHCVKMKMTKYAQRIEFMQLSRSDYAL